MAVMPTPAIEIDHVAIAATDSARSARFLADLLGDVVVEPAGPDDDMTALRIGHDATLLYMTAPHTPRQHLALRVDGARFARAVAGLRARGIPYGNDPAAPENGETADCLGSGGRVYFSDLDGHLIELVTSG
jgi:catechol 2,3-dioxygenase-like lactoylglutathione lyase family enzyme